MGDVTSFVYQPPLASQPYYFAVAGRTASVLSPLSQEVVAPPAVTSAPLPPGWLADDVGAVARQGSTTSSGGTFVLRGSGADVWGTRDDFHFAWRELTGDGTIVARATALSGSEPWTKIGVMVRSSTAPDAAHAFMLVSRAKGLAFQRRLSDGDLTTHTSGALIATPVWLKLTRIADMIVASVSVDGSEWVRVGEDKLALPPTVLIGLAVSSHDTSTLASGTFDSVTVSSGAQLPQGWSTRDVGAVGTPGTVAYGAGMFTIGGSGGDIWGTADAFRFVWHTLPGDGKIIARVSAIAGEAAWVKAGVMVRQTLDSGSAHALMLASKANGLAFQRRPLTGSTSVHSGIAGEAPVWLKLSRVGTTVTASVSPDGRSWQVVGRDTVSLVGAAHFGLAVSSHDGSRLASATFDNVILSTDP